MAGKLVLSILLLLNSVCAFAQAGGAAVVEERQLEVPIGIDIIENIPFDYNTKISIGNEKNLKLVLYPQKREIVFKGQKPGDASVTIRDSLGDIKLKYLVKVTVTGKSTIVSQLKELIGDVEGLEISIKGEKVVVGGEIVVPDDIGRVSKVLANFPEVLTLIELSPQTQRVIARKMADEFARNSLKDVTVRVVNKAFWLEGVVPGKDKKDLALIIAKAYLPPKIASLSSADSRFATPGNTSDIIDFIAIDEKKAPQPSPKMIKVTSQFVQLVKNYSKIFAFKWAPLMGEDGSEIRFGQTAQGNITTTSQGTLSATISNLFPKLNAARTAGYARVLQSGMVIMRESKQNEPMRGTIKKQTQIPFAVGSGEFTKASTANLGLNMDVTSKILEQEKVELAINIDINLSVGTSQPPIVTNNSVSTNVIIKSKESAAIGGVVQNESTTEYDNEPASTATAGSAPATPLFRLFRSKSYVQSKSQFVIFITPEIVESASAGSEEIRKKFRRRE